MNHSDKDQQGGAPRTGFPPVDALDGFLQKADTLLNIMCVSLIMFLMFFAAAEIIGRYFFNAPIPGHIEIVELVMVGVVFLGLAYTQLQNGHIRMQILQQRFFKGRFYHLSEILFLLLSLVVFAVITRYSFISAMESYEFGDVTSYINWPTWPSKMCIPVGTFFLCLRIFMQLVQRICASIWYQPEN